MATDSQRRIFRFGVFEADESTGDLRKQGIRIKLHAQPFQLLVMLLERPSELVSRDEMRQKLWGDDTFVDFDHGLNSAINKVREALGDSAAQPRYIETIAGRGYRFLSPVGVGGLVAPKAATSSANVSEPEKPEGTIKRPIPRATAGVEVSEQQRSLLAKPQDLPTAPRNLVRALLLMAQAMYLAFYVAALANLDEIRGIFADSQTLSPGLLMTLLVLSAVVMIPVRLFFFTAVAFDYSHLQARIRRLFPVLLLFDLLWALSPFLLIHHVNAGAALAMTAALVYIPFAQRSLVLMLGRR